MMKHLYRRVALNQARRTALRSAAAIAIAAGTIAASRTSALAQDVGPQPPNASNEQVNPKIYPGVVAPAAPSGFSGPLATFAGPLAAKGITFHILDLDFAEVNPSLGLQRGRGANSNYTIAGIDIDLGKMVGLQGTSLHYENVFFSGVRNLNIATEIGDRQVGYQPPYTPRVARLSRATIEQKAIDDRLDIELGVTHPGYYYALPNCNSINSCFQDVLYEQGGWTSPLFAVPGGNISYKATPTIYVEAGAFAQQADANVHVGYDFDKETYDGVVALAEIGYKTDFDTVAYPSRFSLTGFVNTANHEDFNTQTAFGLVRNQSGTGGVVVQGQQIVWRKDGGTEKNLTPTAIGIFGSFGAATDSTVPVSADMWIGATLYSPFADRPADRFNLKINYERLNTNYANYLTAANLASGGNGSPYSPNKVIFEASAHLQAPLGTAFEPVVQYEIHPDSFFNPTTPVKAHDGVYIGGTFVIPVGVILGLAAKT